MNSPAGSKHASMSGRKETPIDESFEDERVFDDEEFGFGDLAI